MDDDLIKRNKSRLAQKEAVKQYRDELQDQKSKRQVKPTYYQGYNAETGKHQIQTLGDSTTSANRIITNGAIPTGSSVNFTDGFLDSMPRVKATVAATSTAKTTPNIKYVYITGGRTSTKTALYVAGYKAGWAIQIDEWNNSEYTLYFATIDNLGSSSFIVSYVLRANGSPNDWVFKVSKNSSISLTQTIESRYNYQAGGFSWPTLALNNNLGFIGVGYGNWVGNSIYDSQSYSVNDTTMNGVTFFRLSDPVINTQISQTVTIDSYVTNSFGDFINTNNNPYGYTTNSDKAYLNPEVKLTSSLLNQYQSPGTSIFLITKIQRNLFQPIRYNAKTGKSLSYFLRSDSKRTDFQGVGFPPVTPPSEYEGFDYSGWNIVNSRNAAPQEIIFRDNLGSGGDYAIYSDYSTQINCTEGSKTATYISGGIPKAGSMITGGNAFPWGTLIESVSGGTITFDQAAVGTTDLPTVTTFIYTGFLNSNSIQQPQNGWSACIDLLSQGVSYFPTTLVKQTALLSTALDVFVAVFNNALVPNTYKKVQVYSPVVNPGNPTILGSNNFKVLHASYSSS